MQTFLEPVGSEVQWHEGADVSEIISTSSGLRIVVAAPAGVDRHLEIHFPFVRAFQVMDEGDMLEYWESPLTTGHLLYKVISGGWRDRTAGHFLHVTASLDSMQEWLIVSECLCVSVLSAYVPHLREFGDAS
ncbi:hypothetical protein LN565_11245 [Xanthomonas euvesicatoria pv. euvesicatoria]|uniref:Uncharacterized protein n=2 Tax=Xanthomonas euvesicatoria TaxID=456327 RepID=A0A6B3KKY5_XANEU|nr:MULTISPECIES: hypothetical protein [Xanthomonas]AOY68036.1 hypothetical protein BHE83_16695 [Xanthomonas euvesicatoria pv. vesicatoria str. 85-10]APO92183.1 hypothetical protein BJD11_21120 [Xanthomonas euvesicatoria]KHL60446.1 hypothetical protein XEU66b_16195 [Xanthomonas euvesicatoria]KHL65497.1 hypothetical protein XEU83M_11810 [Xanthomonas euvesicatoria]KLA55400.1 hypothetical protein XEUV683_05700 [Xanthomonas euvesicatoria]